MNHSFSRMYASRLSSLLFAIALLVFFISAIDRTFESRNTILTEQRVIATLSKEVNAKIDSVFSDLLMLKTNLALQNYIANPNSQNLTIAANEFQKFSRILKNYDQVRLLSANGMEVIRINQQNGQPVVVPAEQLQTKHHRPYFYKSTELHSQSVYISEFDLNIEHNQIEVPWKPTIRIATRVDDPQGNLAGVLVLNYLGNSIIKLIEAHNAINSGSIMLLNSQGQWLYGKQHDKDLGFHFDDEHRFYHDYPDEWQIINHQHDGKKHINGGYLVYNTIHMPREDWNNPFTDSIRRNWKLISRLPADMITANSTERLQTLLWISPLIIILFGLIAWLWAKASFQYAVRLQRINELSRVVEQSDELVYITDHKGTILYVNPAFERTTGFSYEEAVGNTPRLIKSGEHDDEFYKKLWKNILSGHKYEDVFINKKKDGSYFYEEKLITPIHDKNGNIIEFVSTGRDISELENIKKLRNSLHQLAYRDHLTGLANRLYLNEQLERILIEPDRMEKLIVVMFVDLDNFKTVNDTFGHDAGDSLLRNMANRLKESLRIKDTLARISGDEFVIILEDVNQISYAEVVADKIVKALDRPFMIGEDEIHISGSIGITLYPFEDIKAERVLNQADIAMYHAKKSGKNRFSFYHHGM